jgi:hypothetical protein
MMLQLPGGVKANPVRPRNSGIRAPFSSQPAFPLAISSSCVP